LSFAAILRAKVGDHRLQRKIALEGHRFTAKEAHEDGLLDHLVAGNTADVLSKAEQVAEQFAANAQAGVWGLIKVLFLCPKQVCLAKYPYSAIYTVILWKQLGRI
jgi:enoyl-CoA hydratase/carnithine racemase